PQAAAIAAKAARHHATAITPLRRGTARRKPCGRASGTSGRALSECERSASRRRKWYHDDVRSLVNNEDVLQPLVTGSDEEPDLLARLRLPLHRTAVIRPVHGNLIVDGDVAAVGDEPVPVLDRAARVPCAANV